MKIPENYFLSEVNDPKHVDMGRIEKMVDDGGVIAQYETQKDGAVWLKVYREREAVQ